jgi:hypothetical protein
VDGGEEVWTDSIKVHDAEIAAELRGGESSLPNLTTFELSIAFE